MDTTLTLWEESYDLVDGLSIDEFPCSYTLISNIIHSSISLDDYNKKVDGKVGFSIHDGKNSCDGAVIGIVVLVDGKVEIVRNELVESFYSFCEDNNNRLISLIDVNGHTMLKISDFGWNTIYHGMVFGEYIKKKLDEFAQPLLYAQMNKKILTLAEADDIIECVYGIENQRLEIACIKDWIDKVKKNIEEKRLVIADARKFIDFSCEECANALNELEKKYGIGGDRLDYYLKMSNYELNNVHPFRICCLIDTVRLGYDVMDGCDYHNAIINDGIKDIESGHSKIEKYEGDLREMYKEIEYYKFKLVKYGYNIDNIGSF